MPNISRGDRMDGLMRYLVGPGRQDEHVNPHLVAGSPALMAWWSDSTLDEAAALAIAKDLDHPRQVYRVKFSEKEQGPVWHCSLALKAEEGDLGDEKWGEIAEDFMRRMGFIDEAKAPVRYAVIDHGPTVNGNFHVHIAASLVREDGTKANTWNDRPRAQKACREIEQKFGLQVVESRGVGMGERGRKKYAIPRAEKGQQGPQVAETYDERLERYTRAVAATAGSEAEFVRGMRKLGLLMRPRFADGGETVVEGWSVAARPPKGQRPKFRAGGTLAKDLTIDRLREAHWPADPNDPAAGAAAAMAAAAEWRSAKRNRRLTPADGTPVMDPALQRRYAEEVAGLNEQLRAVPPGDIATWSAVAHHLSGTFAAWSLHEEGPVPGPLARTAATLSRTAQVPRQPGTRPTHDAWGPSIRGVSLILASAGRGGRGPVGIAVLVRQLANTAKALHDAHAAADLAQEAERISLAILGDLQSVRAALPSDELRQHAQQRAAEAGQTVGGGRPVPPGSPIPAHLQPHRAGTPQRSGGPER